MIKCPNCGAENKETNTYCHNCFNKLIKIDSPEMHQDFLRIINRFNNDIKNGKFLIRSTPEAILIDLVKLYDLNIEKKIFIDVLTNNMKDSDNNAKCYSVKVLGFIGDVESLKVLNEIKSLEKDKKVQLCVKYAIKSIQQKKKRDRNVNSYIKFNSKEEALFKHLKKDDFSPDLNSVDEFESILKKLYLNKIKINIVIKNNLLKYLIFIKNNRIRLKWIKEEQDAKSTTKLKNDRIRLKGIKKEENTESALGRGLDALIRKPSDSVKEDLRESFYVKGDNNNLPLKLSELDYLSGVAFEEFLRLLFDKMHYKVEKTSYSHDQGADLILIDEIGVRIAVQAKRSKNKIGNNAIQEITAALNHYGADKGIVITNNEFTNAAINLARSNRIKLMDRFKLEQLMNNYPVIKKDLI
ncbi:MAG: restriction endonuclease [Methanobacterium sp.]